MAATGEDDKTKVKDDVSKKDAFVSPEDPSKEKLEARLLGEARIQAAKDEGRRGKVGYARALADGKAVGKAEAGVGSRTTISQRISPDKWR